MEQYLGIDFHRRRSVIVRMDADGEVISSCRVYNDPLEIAAVVCDGPLGIPVAIEATYGWYWIVDLLLDLGFEVHLAHPASIGQFGDGGRVKNDFLDAKLLAHLLRAGLLPESWVAPPETRALRELVRFRQKLVGARAGLKSQTHSILAKEGILPDAPLWSQKGSVYLDGLELGDGFSQRTTITRTLIAAYGDEIDRLDEAIAGRLRDNPDYQAVTTIKGIGPVLGAIFVTEIGDVSRFDSPKRLASWSGLTPKHKESDTSIKRGTITKQGSRLVRWAAVEAVTSSHCHPYFKTFRRDLEVRRPAQVAKIAAARKLIGWVYWALRDGEVRCLTQHEAA